MRNPDNSTDKVRKELLDAEVGRFIIAKIDPTNERLERKCKIIAKTPYFLRAQVYKDNKPLWTICINRLDIIRVLD